jgi:hypothetical protein
MEKDESVAASQAKQEKKKGKVRPKKLVASL